MAKRRFTYDIFVGNLPPHTDQLSVGKIFTCFGEISGIYVKDGKIGDGSKIEFVQFLCEPDAEQAVKERNGILLDGNPLIVRRSSKRDGPREQGYQGRKFEKKGKKQMNDKKINAFNGTLTAGSGSSNSLKKTFTDSIPNLEYYGIVGASEEELIVVHIEDPTIFYSQKLESNQHLAEITNQLSQVCPKAKSVQGIPQMFKIYGAQFSEDQQWYRCEIIKNNMPDQCAVRYIDFGNREVVSNQKIVDLPDELASIPPLAFKCRFQGLRGTMMDTGNKNFEEGKKFLSQVTDGHIVHAYLRPPPGEKIVCCWVINGSVNGLNLGQELVKKGYAVEVERDGTIINSKNIEDSSLSGRPVLGKKMDQRYCVNGRGGRQYASGHRLSLETPPNTIINTLISTQIQIPGTLNDLSQSSSLDDDLYTNYGTGYSYHRSGNQFRGDGDGGYVIDEISRLKFEKEKLLNDLALEKGRFQAVKNELDRMIKDDMSLKVSEIQEKTKKVKFFRHSLTYDKDKIDIIELCITTILKLQEDPVLDHNQSVKEAVSEAHKTFNSCQQNIKSCKNKDELQSLIELRDSAKQQFCVKIEQFLNLFSQYPVFEKARLLEMLLSCLNQYYHPFLCMADTNMLLLPLSDLSSFYQNMKNQKQEKVQEVRRQTNDAMKQLSQVLQAFSESVLLEDSYVGPSSAPEDHVCYLEYLLEERPQEFCTASSLSKCLADYYNALNVEISECDMEATSESALMAVVTQKLQNELNNEWEKVQDLAELKVQYSSLFQELSPWLHNKPDITEVMAIRKTIKGLKSKLRHKIADKNDVEENDESDKEALESINSELAVLRKELHEAFDEESKLLKNLAELQESHFPEVDIQYSELGISSYVEYLGLLKLGWELDYFQAEKLLVSQSFITYRAVYRESEVIVKEYFIDNDQQKKEFLRRVVQYHHAACDNLVPLQAVFFSKNERQGYTVSPCPSNTLLHKVENCSLTAKEKKNILQGVLKGLGALHTLGIVHGALHPLGIFYSPDGFGIIDTPDFSRNEVQRLAVGTTTPVNGISFHCPETMYKEALTVESDMYIFGCLMLWLMFPTVKFTESPVGVPDFSALNMDPRSCEYSIICSLLMKHTDEGLSVHDLLSSEFFTSENCEESNNPKSSLTQDFPQHESHVYLRNSIKNSLYVEEHYEQQLISSELGAMNNSDQFGIKYHDMEPDCDDIAVFNALRESIGGESNSFPCVDQWDPTLGMDFHKELSNGERNHTCIDGNPEVEDNERINQVIENEEVGKVESYLNISEGKNQVDVDVEGEQSEKHENNNEFITQT
ncbi:serine/threonine-protein kinase 31-like isoform X2 [Tachypleus tridentatus]|uniref:serine/threonine-protein kinase 31-like isoform X2 n=1 Tax=Tachypleus tridentatus TaxID=6853 RepID=UPI003FD3211D